MTNEERFFYHNAAYSWHPETETKAQGKRRGAKALAAAERHARAEGWQVRWEPDMDGCGCEDGPHEAEFCELWDAEGEELLASLSGICGATDAYRRVVEAELALDAVGKEGK